MIAPRFRLLWVFAIVALPAATVLTLLPGLELLCGTILALFALFVLTDVAFSLDRFLPLKLEAPALVRLSKNRPGILTFRLTNEGDHAVGLHLAPDLPKEIVPAQEELCLVLEAREAVTLSFSCTPRRRGRFLLRNVPAGAATRFGFWNLRHRFSIGTELRVYPDLLAERQNLAAIFLHRGEAGAKAVRRVGKGRDFEQLRDYIAGDSVEDIHWKATAKRGRPITKVFQVEQTQEVYVVLDASRLSARLSGGEPALEKFITCALILCLAAGQRNDLFGLTVFADKVQSFVRAKNGQSHYNLCRDTLYRLQPASVTPDFHDLFTFLRLHLRRRALLVFLTALDDPALATAFGERIELLSRQHLVLVNMLRPPDACPLFADDTVKEINQIYRKLAGHLVWHDLRELSRRLHHLGVELALLDHARLAPEVVAQYLRVKQRQIL